MNKDVEKKLFLSSFGIPNQDEFIKLFGSKNAPRIAVVTNAWDPYDQARSQPYIDAIEKQFIEMNLSIERLDLLNYVKKSEELDQHLQLFDGVWLTGGNAFYLNWCVHQSGFDKIIAHHCTKGLVYGGESAGAVIAGPTLQYFQSVDNPDGAPEMIVEGLGLTDTVVVPHIDTKKYGDKLAIVNANLEEDGYKTMPLTDSQALVVDGITTRKIFAAENEWPLIG